MKERSRAVIYARVSSTGDRQDTERQVADTLLLSELSRLGRSVRKILDVTDDLTKAGINIHILDLNIDTMLPDGTENPVAKMLLTVLGLGAEIERRNIVSRLNSGRQLAIARGIRMGRPFGSGMSDEELLKKYPDVVRRPPELCAV